MGYVKGRRAEYRCIRFLKKQGAKLVVRSAGSHGPADVVAFFPERKEIWLVQVKTGKRTPSLGKLRKEYGVLKELEGVYKVRALLFVKKGGRYVLLSM